MRDEFFKTARNHLVELREGLVHAPISDPNPSDYRREEGSGVDPSALLLGGRLLAGSVDETSSSVSLGLCMCGNSRFQGRGLRLEGLVLCRT